MKGDVRVTVTKQINITVSGTGVHMWRFDEEEAKTIYEALKTYFNEA